MKKNKYKDIIKNLLLFTLSKFIPKTISFFLVPFYTIYLSTYEYGVLDIINTTVSLAIPILTLNIKDAVLRFALEKDSNKKSILNVPLVIVFIDFLILIFFTFIELRFKIFRIKTLYLFSFDAMLLVQSLYDNLTSFSKGIEKIRTIIFASSANAIVTLLLNILLISVFNLNLKGYFIANTIGYVIAIIIYIICGGLFKYFSFNFDKKYFKDMIIYSFPMIFSALSWWINYSSDKYIVTFMIGIEASGIYAVASKLPSVLTTFQNIFMEAWSISAIKEFDKEDSDGFIGNMFTIVLFVLSIICSILIILNIVISKILFNGSFFIAWKYVPPLLLSVLVDALALFIGNIFYAVKDTKARALVTIVAAIINTILNVVLIYYFGAYGAAIATLIGYFSGFVFSAILVKKYVKMKTDMKRNYFVLLLLLLQVIISIKGNKYVLIQILMLLLIMFLFIKDIKSIINAIVNIFKTKIKKASSNMSR